MIVSTDTRSPDFVTSSVRTGPAPAIFMLWIVPLAALAAALGAAALAPAEVDAAALAAPVLGAAAVAALLAAPLLAAAPGAADVVAGPHAATIHDARTNPAPAPVLDTPCLMRLLMCFSSDGGGFGDRVRASATIPTSSPIPRATSSAILWRDRSRPFLPRVQANHRPSPPLRPVRRYRRSSPASGPSGGGSAAAAHRVRHAGGRSHHEFPESGDPRPGETPRRTGHADRRGDGAVKAEYRCRHCVQLRAQLTAIDGEPTRSDFHQRRLEGYPPGDRRRREPLWPGVEDRLAGRLRLECQEDLAERRRMRRVAAADPAESRDRLETRPVVDDQRPVAVPHREVDRLVGDRAEPVERRRRQPAHVEARERIAREGDEADAKCHPVGRRIALEQPVDLEGPDDPRHGARVETDATSDLVDPDGPWLLRDSVEDVRGVRNRTDGAKGGCLLATGQHRCAPYLTVIQESTLRIRNADPTDRVSDTVSTSSRA